DSEEDDSFNFKKEQLDERKLTAINSLADALEGLTNLNNTMTSLFTRKIKNQITDIKQMKNRFLSLSMMKLSLQNETEIQEVHNLYKEFCAKMSKFDRDTLPDQASNHNLFISIYPIGEFELNEEESEDEDEREEI
ncbi:MAG: hypothetical protein ACTSVZ_03175, partial [Promethearchaeota archaeon]